MEYVKLAALCMDNKEVKGFICWAGGVPREKEDGAVAKTPVHLPATS